ncbi:MAG: hypothetical protein HY040_07470 [Planctomycetes bacterium]|nr:hypothetical protein [Planctomycetota bacterium]
MTEVERPDRQNVDKKDGVEALGEDELRRQLGDVVGLADEKNVAFVIERPGLKCAKEPGGHAAFALADRPHWGHANSK